MKSTIFYLGLAGFGLYAVSHYLKYRKESGSDLLNINSATEKQLGRLPGMVDELIERVMENRPYASKIDLIGRMVIPSAIYEQIKHDITCSRAA